MLAAYMCMRVRPSTGIETFTNKPTKKCVCVRVSLLQQLPVASSSSVKGGARRASTPSVWPVQHREHDRHGTPCVSQQSPPSSSLYILLSLCDVPCAWQRAGIIETPHWGLSSSLLSAFWPPGYVCICCCPLLTEVPLREVRSSPGASPDLGPLS